MTGSRMRPAIIIAGLLLSLLAVTLQGVQGEELEKVPSEDQCRPYIEKALKDLGTEGSQEQTSAEDAEAANDDNHEGPGEDTAADANETDEKSESREKRDVSAEGGDEAEQDGDNEGNDKSDENEPEQEQVETVEISSAEDDDQDNGSVLVVGDEEAESVADSKEDDGKSKEADAGDSKEAEEAEEPSEGGDSAEAAEEESAVAEDESGEQKDGDETYAQDENEEIQEVTEEADEAPEGDNVEESAEQTAEEEEADAKSGEEDKSAEEETVLDSQEEAEVTAESVEEEAATGDDDDDDDQKEGDSKEEEADKSGEQEEDDKKSVEEEEVVAKEAASVEQEPETAAASEEAKDAEDDGKTEETASEKAKEEVAEKSGEAGEEKQAEGEAEAEAEEEEDAEGEGEDSRPEEEELIMEIDIPEILRPRDHINQLLKLDEENELKEKAVEKVADVVLRDLKRLYDNAIKPLETLYKYRDLSNRHFGDPEIFSKPLVLFMGPWSGGKSSIINYLLNIEYKPTSLRTGAEPSPAYFNILMHGEEEEVLDGTQLAADWTFSGLQKFGQGLLDRLKGYKLKSKLLEKVNIVEIPGILEIRKQVQRLFPFNDACQWFIDRADIIFLVYDPSKLDVGPETEAILDQLKGREYQTRIILNKADQVKPEELMRVQGALIWNISPLMSSAEPPVMYSASLWSIPYEAGAPTRLLYAQERAFLRDLRSAVDKRVEHKIASARRFAVRVRNHAKMVDCYLTTYYNQKGFFSKKKDISDRIIENPQDYHIYEGLSTLTNISRYDLPDPDVYRDFFRLNPLYEFPLLSSTCTYFRGCPINRLDVAIAYDLPELVGKYKKSVEAALHQEEEITAAPTPAPTPAAQQQAQKPTARSGAGRISMS
ncbi:sarcalumenin isoform X2 [Nasonia vitripennis]|uniref:Dynamin-type G domain-containing protein n=1 Tax=Nasonia vitripennis TaxID=7425 RepID=A0A7M7QNG6_NASVI|nr:sarcalumenin isoform X2 [Nasonia vitripennis]